MPWGQSSQGGPYRCSNCGEEWDTHPVLEVDCPDCGAKAHTWCKRPSEHPAMELHVSREQRALDLGFLKPCPASQRSREPQQGPLFAAVGEAG